MNTSLVFCLKPSRSFLLATVATGAVIGFSSPTLAVGFTGIFAPANFTLNNTSADGTVDDTNAASGTVILTGGNNDSFTSGTTTWIANITQGGTVSFDWSFAGESVPYTEGLAGDRGGYIINGTPTYLGFQDGDYHSVSSLSVTAGQTFGFIVETANNTGGAGHLTITDFNFTPQPIPEPSTILGIGAVALLGLVGKMYSKIQSWWRGSGRNHSRHRGHKD
ncbi:MAG: PEP-CTERM sorting domain-containing protein [Microcystis panniformis WG22]|nr:PEP-CTERM sorting domain-containing protein [Microcystis panniformis WG22]